MDKRQRFIVAGEIVAAVVACAAAVIEARPSDWQPYELVVLLFVLASVSDLLMVEVRGMRVSGSFLAMTLAMALLGPEPAVFVAVGSVLVYAVVQRRPVRLTLLNVAAHITFPVAGAIAIRVATGGLLPAQLDPIGFAAIVLCVFMATNLLNFVLIAPLLPAAYGYSFRELMQSAYLPVLPSAFATGLLTAGVAFSYGRLGVGAVGLLIVVIFVFQYLVRAGVQAFERGEELQARTRQLATLQVGLLGTVLQTLSMRDAMTARHSAAVARYSREVARMLGLGEKEQELIHTAALLHDIGKFIFPDSILFADRKLTDDEWETVKLHPEQGARLVERIDGYGPVAEIVLHHHERYSGGGYPAGICADEIPLGSRIIAAADTYDVMTSRDSYRRPVSSEAALAELRRVAGTQLDPQVVEVFERMILERRVAFRHGDEADFELELALERRIQDYARPRALAA